MKSSVTILLLSVLLVSSASFGDEGIPPEPQIGVPVIYDSGIWYHLGDDIDAIFDGFGGAEPATGTFDDIYKDSFSDGLPAWEDLNWPQTWLIEFDLFAPNDAMFTVREFDGQPALEFPLAATSPAEVVHYAFSVGGNRGPMRFECIYAGDDAGDFAFGNWQATPLPEPATLSMMVLGGAAILRRRRC